MGINNGLMFSNNPSNFNGPATNGVSGQILFGQGTTATPIWANSASLPPVAAIGNNYFNGYIGASGAWIAIGTSYQILTPFNGNTLVTIFQNGLTCSTAGNSLCGFAFLPASSSSVYQISMTTTVYESAANNGAFLQLTDGATPFAFGACNQASVADCIFPMTVSGVYKVASGNTITISVQGGCVGANTMTIGSGVAGVAAVAKYNVQFSIFQIA